MDIKEKLFLFTKRTTKDIQRILRSLYLLDKLSKAKLRNLSADTSFIILNTSHF